MNKTLHIVSFALVVIGALNWGLVGLFGFNLVSTLLGDGSMLERLVYILVGVAALVIVVTHKNDCKVCGSAA
ncbi:MAG: DUF378 domain-containing protein [Candidatus Andersenbacteria bacterium]